MKVKLDPEALKALYSRLLAPVKLSDGSPAYTISVNLARELRLAIDKALSA